MAITQGTWGGLSDLGITEKLFGSKVAGTPLSGLLINPLQGQALQGGLLTDQTSQNISKSYQDYNKIPSYTPTGTVAGVTSYAPNPEKQQAAETHSQSSLDALIQDYKNRGWTDETAIRNDIAATGGPGENNNGPGGAYLLLPLLSKNYSNTNLSSSLGDVGTGGTPTGGNDIFKEIYDAAAAGNQSAIDIINSQYGQNESELNRQLGMTDTYQGNDLNSLLTQFQGVQGDVSKQKQEGQDTVTTQTGQAADQARMTQKQNRNVLRALGILGSTYAAENLAAPINQFDKQKAELVNWGNKRMAELDTYMNQKKNEYDNLVNDVRSKYGELRDKIMGDLRYNGQQKADALRAATAGAQQNLASLNMQKAQYEQQMQQYQQGLTTQIAQMLMNKAPNANLQDIASQSIAFTNQLQGTSPNKQVATYQGVNKGTPAGFDMSKYVGWDPNAALQDWLSKNRNNSLTG